MLLAVGSRWESASRRVLWVGQETLGWDWKPGLCYPWPHRALETLSDFLRYDDAVEALVDGYSVFDFARGIVENRRNLNGSFWRAFHSMRENISREGNADMLATNLLRFDVDKGGSVIKVCDLDELRQILDLQHSLLTREIRVLKPTAVLFFTGPRYDLVLREEFDGVEIYSLRGRDERQFAGVRHPDLPSIAIRTYHPSYLNRSKERRSWLQDIARCASA